MTVTTIGRARLFDDFESECIASASFESRSLLGEAKLLAWVLMPDHAHWLVQLGATEPLAGLVGRMKSASARNMNRARGRAGPLWARAFHGRAMRREESL